MHMCTKYFEVLRGNRFIAFSQFIINIFSADYCFSQMLNILNTVIRFIAYSYITIW
jgi:hypothetical protein